MSYDEVDKVLMSNNIPGTGHPVCKSELSVTISAIHPSSGAMGAAASQQGSTMCMTTSRQLPFATSDFSHLDHHLPPAGNKSRSVDSMSHSSHSQLSAYNFSVSEPTFPQPPT